MAGQNSDKYFVQANMHNMAHTKYTAAAKTAGDPAHAKKLRAVGKHHKAVADGLAAIANLHVANMFSRQQAQRKTMPQAIKEETEMAEEAQFDPIRALISAAIDKNAMDFQDIVNEVMVDVASVLVEDIRVAMYEAKDDESEYDDDEKESDGEEGNDQAVAAGEDDEKLGESVEAVDEITVPIPGQKTTGKDKGKNVGDGDNGPRTIKKVAFSKKKPEQKSTSVAAGDTVRSQEAAD